MEVDELALLREQIRTANQSLAKDGQRIQTCVSDKRILESELKILRKQEEEMKNALSTDRSLDCRKKRRNRKTR